MTDKDFLQKFPVKRIKPIDGMAVTAETWEEAHEYHRQYERFHTLLHHGWGIVTGLEVISVARKKAESSIAPLRIW